MIQLFLKSRLVQSISLTACALGLSAVSHGKEVSFEKDVLPVLEEKCFKCHKAPYKDERGRTRKPKSGYRMDYRAGFEKGGDYQEDGEYTALVPGDSSKSAIYTFLNLHEDEDLHMPTKGDDLTDAEKKVLKAWIDAGADFGAWVGKE